MNPEPLPPTSQPPKAIICRWTIKVIGPAYQTAIEDLCAGTTKICMSYKYITKIYFGITMRKRAK